MDQRQAKADRDRGEAARGEEPARRGADRENGWLRVLGELQILFGTLEAQLRDREAECGVDVVEDLARRGVMKPGDRVEVAYWRARALEKSDPVAAVRG